VVPVPYGNLANPKAHYEGTGPEIWRTAEVTHFVSGLGTSGTLMGVGRFLKERNPAIQVWAVEPPAGEMVDGLKSLDEGFIPPVFTESNGFDLLDRKKVIGPEESIVWTRRLIEVGVFAGISTGAALAAAVKCAGEIDEGVIVTIAATAGGSTCRRGRGRRRSTRSSPGPSELSTSERRPTVGAVRPA